MLELGVKSLLAYLLGSLIGSLVVGQLRGGVDIRTLGSGNAGHNLKYMINTSDQERRDASSCETVTSRAGW